MIKSIVILALVICLLAAAFFTRPSEASFEQLVRTQKTAEAGNFIDKLLLERRIKGYLEDCKYNDRLLWVDVTHDGKKIYTGLFSRWYERGAKAQADSTRSWHL